MNRILFIFLFLSHGIYSQDVHEYSEVLKKYGQSPSDFIDEKLRKHDLLIFDDGLHSALEPFEFYGELLESKKESIDFVFIEVFSIKHQSHIDDYLRSKTKDSTLLLKIFQDDISGYGWQYETYHTLLSKVWDINSTLNQENKIKVVGVDQPVYWESIKTRKDYDVFLKSLTGRDYFMYKVIVEHMNNFEENKKGIFLTNTRHAYKHIRNRKGSLYWNCGTFLNQWHPEKTFSIRIHNVQLSIEKSDDSSTDKSADGLGRYNYRWIQMENGLWDEAFKTNNNSSIAIPFEGNIFGKSKYVGNHMLNVAEGQSMYDAYDALVFIKPLDNLHFSAKLDFFYTPTFKKELERRILLLHDNKVDELLAKNKVPTLESYINIISKYQPTTKNELLEKK